MINKITLCVILMNSLLISIETAEAKNRILPNYPINSEVEITEDVNNIDNMDQNLPNWKLSKIAVINQNQQVEQKPFMWVFSHQQEIGKLGKQPFLQVIEPKKRLKKETSIKTNNTKSGQEEELKSYQTIIKDTQKSAGIFIIHRHLQTSKVYLEIKPEQLKKNFLATATLEAGIGERGIYSGIPLNDFLFYFQKIDNKLQFVVRNVKFRIRPGDPQKKSIDRSFSDSVLYSISIKSINPRNQNILIDLGDLLLTDLSGLTSNLELTNSPENSYLSQAKVFPENLEIQSIFNFKNPPNSANRNLGVLADNRGFTLKVHYSLSQLPNSKYQPRLADERVGYFVTAYQDLSKNTIKDPFVRYINRWYLEKKDPQAKISPPKKPIVFWIDNAVPLEYRDAIKEGVLMWNQGFLKAGFKDAIEVKQMPDNATWNPGDIRYNTIRWINTLDGFFALGPSRVNPITGEILNANIVFDASFLRLLKNEYRQIIQPQQSEKETALSILGILGKNDVLGQQNQEKSEIFSNLSKLGTEYDLCYGLQASYQLAFGALSMLLLRNNLVNSQENKNYIHDYLRLIIAHEVGHTLGLRHNFRGSNYLSPEELNNAEITKIKGLTSSVMDYLPPNIAPYGKKQGDYFPKMIGPYDEWAIAYGYTPSNAKTAIEEKPFLNAIAASSNQQELSYATDEDVANNDPSVSLWDHSNNPLVYAENQLMNNRIMWEKLNKFSNSDLDSYSDITERFNTILINYLQNLEYTIDYVGGQYFYRLKPGENKGKLPFVIVPIVEQRQALKNLQKYVFAEDALNFSPQLLNKLAPSRWRHWGSNIPQGRLDYPNHNVVLFVQTTVLNDLLSGDRLRLLKDLELKNPPGQALTLPELFNTLQMGIWTEVFQSQGKVKISSLRRGLQRQYLTIFTEMVLRKNSVPEDARTLAWYKLKELNQQLKRVSSDDEYTKAFLLETSDRIEKILSSSVIGN